MNIVHKQIDELIPYAKNARTHSDSQVAQIAASIREFGWMNPVLIDAENNIIAGHGRVLAARKLGLEEVPCVLHDHLTETQRKAYILADNKMALNAGWDEDMLRLELRELGDMGFDLELTGFDDVEIDSLLADPSEGLTDPDDIPEVPEGETVTVPGDVWVLGRHRLMCGDSTSIDAVEKLMDGHKADMVFTDPPYGVDYDGGHTTEKRREKLANDADVDMYDLPIKNAYLASTDKAPIYLWFADRFAIDVLNGLAGAGYQVRNWIFWNKNLAQFGAIGAQYKLKHEPCIYAFKKGKSPNWCGPNNEVTVWDVKREPKNAFHPTQKPVELPERAINNSSKTGDIVLDLFGGSGSTLIACEQLDRTCYMMELDPKYCDVIVKRWEDFTGKKAILEESEVTTHAKSAAYPD